MSLSIPVIRRATCCASLLFGGIALSLAVGCGRSSNDISVNGRAAFRGQPISKGVIAFFPVQGRPVTAPITEPGEYNVELPPGEYTVTINNSVDVPAGYREGDPLPTPKIALPSQYSVRTKSVLKVNISEEQSKPLNFDLQ